MRYYTKIPIWESKRRLRKLTEFRKLFVSYFNNSRADWMVEERIEEPEAQRARVQINLMLDEVHDIIICSGINPIVRWTPPPAVGGYIQNINLVQNIFQIHRFEIAPNNVLDYIDRAIGVYGSNQGSALLRSLNPFFYIGLVLDWISEIPFAFIGRLGFNRDKAESSIVGRAIKGILYLITLLASLLTILQLLGYLEPVKESARRVIGSN